LCALLAHRRNSHEASVKKQKAETILASPQCII